MLPGVTVFKKIGFCLAFAAFLPLRSESQRIPDDLAFERLSIPGTMHSSQVAQIIQDRSGVLWFAGHGLFRYDGYGFRQYRTLSGTGATINPHDINDLIYDSISHRILIGAHRFGMLAYDYRTDQLTKMYCGKSPPVINQLVQTTDGRIWAASFNEGLFYLENDSLRKVGDQHALFDHPTALLAQENRVFVGGPAKVVVLEDGYPVDEIMLSFEGNDFPRHADVTAMHIDQHNNLWIGTQKLGVVVYNLTAKTFEKHFKPDAPPFFSMISQIHEDSEGLLWILTKANGLGIYSPEHDKVVHVFRDPFSPNSISTDNCFSILEDRGGIIWIGGTGDINKFDRHQLKFKHVYHNPLNRLSLTDNMIRGVYEDSDGKIWVGTDAGYVNVIDLDNDNIEYRKVSIDGSVQQYVPVYFCALNDEVTLVGSYSGLLQWDKRTKKFSPYRPLWKFTKDRVVRQILRKGSHLYFISQSSLFIYDLGTGQLEQFNHAGDDEATNLTAIYLDHKERLWVGSARGISLFDEASRTFQFFEFKNVERISEGAFLLVLSINQVDDQIYAGTFNAGLWQLDLNSISSSEPKMTHITVRDGLSSNTVYAAVPDALGNLWLSTNGGIVKIETRTGNITNFSRNEGMQEEEFNRLAYLVTQDGKIVFGGINGINIFKPEEVQLTAGVYEPQISSMRIYNPLSGDERLITDVSSLESISLKYNENFIDVQFFVPDYSSPRRYSLQYKLDNFENEWKEITNDNKATFTNIGPGTYKFSLRTVAAGRGEHIVEIPIVITSPYWQTWWFIVLSFFVVAFLVMTIIRSYIRKGQHDRARLQELLRIRTFEIEKSREELHVLNQKKDLIFSILSHDLRSPLTTLKGFLGYLIDHAPDLPVDELRRHAISIKNSVTNSLDLIDNTLFWSLSQMGNIQYSPTNFSLYFLLEKLRGLYQLTADKKRISLSIQCPHDMVIHGDENMIYVTLRNLVSNALKFTGEGKSVSITCWPNETFAYVNVSDEGIGMSDEYLRKILSSAQPLLKKGTSNEKGTGLGLLLCMKFVEMNKGEIEVRSSENEGTTFTVKLPMVVKQSLDQALK